MWTPLALHCPHVACLSPITAFGVVMPVIYGAKSFFGPVMAHRKMDNLFRTARLVHLTAVLSTSASPSRSTSILRRMAWISQAPTSSSRGGKYPSLVYAASSTGVEGKGVELTGKRRASSRYISSDYRGVQGGPKGKWKARIVSNGGSKQLGTFE